MALRQTKKISELPALTPATLDTTFVVGISGSTTYKISINQLTSSLDSAFATDLVTTALSGTLDGKLSTSSFNSYTASISTGSLVTSIDNLNTFTASQSTSSLVDRLGELEFSASRATSSIAELYDNAFIWTQKFNLIDSVSGSWITESETGSFLTSLNGAISGSSQLTSSFDTRYTLSGSVVNVNTASLTTSISNLNLFTQSAGHSVSLFNDFTQSFQNYSASLNEIKDDGIFLGYSTRFNFRGNTLSASVTPNVSGLITNIDMLPDTTRLDTSSFNQYTASISTASLVTSISNLNSFTSSQSTIFNGLNLFTQSAGHSVSLFNDFTQSFQNYSASVNEIKDDGIFLGYSTRFNFRGSLISASVTPNVSGLITNIDIQLPSGVVSSSVQVLGGSGVASGSYETTGRGIISSSANLVTTSSFNSYTASISTASLVTSISNLNSATSSYLTSLSGAISSSSQLTSSYDTRYALSASFVSSSNVASIQTITSASYAALTPVSGTLYIIIG